MRINDIIKPLLNETANMTAAQWWKRTTGEDFLNRIADEVDSAEKDKKLPYVFPLTYKDGKSEKMGQVEINGKDDGNYGALIQLKAATEDKDSELLAITDFNINEFDENEKPTGNYVKIPVTNIIKDELFSGKLRVNKGNIAEIVLGCAVTAKYVHPHQHITEEEFYKVAIEVAKNDTFSGSSDKGLGNVTDRIEFMVTVPDADKKGWVAFVYDDEAHPDTELNLVSPTGKTCKDYGMGPALLKDIRAHITNAIKYVNTSPRVTSAVERASKDQRSNVVEIKSDGGNSEEQKSTKADLKILVDGKKINLLSIKAGDVGQFGQVSGYQFERLNEFFTSTVNIPLSQTVQKSFLSLDQKLTSKADVDANKELVRTTNYSTGFREAYNEIYNHLSGLANKNQVDLLTRVYEGLYHHATRGDPNVEMVILSPDAKTAFYELTFGPKLRDALNDYRLSVYRKTNEEKMYEIFIYGWPVSDKAKQEQGTGKELLIKLRSYAQKGAVRNIIEMGDLLKEIADWEKIEARLAAKAANKQTTSANTNNKQSSTKRTPTTNTASATHNQVATNTATSTITPPAVGTGPNVTSIQGNQMTSNPVNDTSTEYDNEEDPETARLKHMATAEMKAILRNAGLLG